MSLPIVLVHGAYHGASCWQQLVPLLERENIEVHCIDLPGHGQSTEPLEDLYGDAQALRTLLKSLDQAPILVGHSYGGAVITEAVNDDHLINHIVYFAAILLDVGETVADFPYFGDQWGFYESMIDKGNGVYALNKDKVIELLYHDCAPEDLKQVLADLCDQKISMDKPVRNAPWRSIDSTYIICDEDRVVPPQIQVEVAKKCRRQITIHAGHMAMISDPGTIAKLLIERAKQ